MSTIHDVTGRRLVSAIYSGDSIYGEVPGSVMAACAKEEAKGSWTLREKGIQALLHLHTFTLLSFSSIVTEWKLRCLLRMMWHHRDHKVHRGTLVLTVHVPILLRGIQLTHVQRYWGSTVKMVVSYKIFTDSVWCAHFPSVIKTVMDQKVQLLKPLN
jgi:hypothetical protein